jgi:hypothetical protein
MRINLISNFNSAGLNHDSAILRGLLTNQFGNDLQIVRVGSNQPECSEAELNIFIEVVNPSLFSYASQNIWIPNPEWTYETWIPYIKMFDCIWVKTRQAEILFKKLTDKVTYIGWTSIDKIYSEKKNYLKAIVLVGKNPYRNPKPLLKAYLDIYNKDNETFKKLPELNIPRNSKEIQFFIPTEIQSKIKLFDTLKENEYDTLLQECGLAICISNCEGYGHAVNEAMSSGCNLILSPIQPFKELTEESQDVLWGEMREYVKHPDCLATLIDTSSESIKNRLYEYLDRSFKERKQISKYFRTLYEKRHRNFIGSFRCPKINDFFSKDLFVAENDLPNVSIITLTYNRKEFLPLAKYCYLIQSYPEDKLEWVIINDGESIEEELFGIPNVKYIQLEQKTGIAEKRNIAIENSMYDTIVIMDDDDVYPNNSVLQRVAMLLRKPEKQCVFSTIIPCYDIEKYTSFMNIPPITLTMSQRISEATLCFTKQFWKDKNFIDDIAEGDKFISGREQMCREISPQEVIVSLVHSKNVSSRKTPESEPNGCHYGFNEKLFALVSEIGETLKLHSK